MMRRGPWLLVLAPCACHGADEQTCYPGDFVYADAAPDGAREYAWCSADGTHYVAYDGDPTVVPEAAPADAAAPDASACDPGAGPLAFMCGGCTSNDQCAAGNTCFPFNNKGAHCTHPCKGAIDCPAPSGGCGNQGVCKPQ